MLAETIRFAPAHGVRLALLFGLPALVPLAFATSGDGAAMIGASLLCVGIGVAAVGFLLLRRTVRLAPDGLQVSHGFYSWRIEKDAIRGVAMNELATAGELPLSLKRNGVAAFGLYSGWFYGGQGEDVFCAVSAQPVYVFRFKGQGRDRILALSCSPAMAAAITAWGNRASA